MLARYSNTYISNIDHKFFVTNISRTIILYKKKEVDEA